MYLNWWERWRPLAAPDVPGQVAPEQGDEPSETVPVEDAPEPAPSSAEAPEPVPESQGDSAPAPVSEPVEPAPAVQQTVPRSRADELVAQRWAETRAREAAEARAQLAEEQLRQLRALAEGQEPGVPQPRANGGLSEEARIQAGVNEALFNQRCNSVANLARAKHGDDFTSSLSALQTASGGRIPRDFVNVALEVGGEEGAGELILALGKDISKADEILRKTPLQQAVALTAMLSEVKRGAPAKEVSKTPAPLRPAVGGTGNTAPGASSPNSKQSIEDWMASREAEVAAEQKRKSARH